MLDQGACYLKPPNNGFQFFITSFPGVSISSSDKSCTGTAQLGGFRHGYNRLMPREGHGNGVRLSSPQLY